jgi:hypothetical protein
MEKKTQNTKKMKKNELLMQMGQEKRKTKCPFLDKDIISSLSTIKWKKRKRKRDCERKKKAKRKENEKKKNVLTRANGSRIITCGSIYELVGLILNQKVLIQIRSYKKYLK